MSDYKTRMADEYRQLDVMDEYANILRRRAEIEHVELGVRRRSDARDKIREALAECGAE